jgi:cytochrome P450
VGPAPTAAVTAWATDFDVSGRGMSPTPVTMARVVTSDLQFAGCPLTAGNKVLLNFPAADRHPELCENADTVVLDREVDRHVAGGRRSRPWTTRPPWSFPEGNGPV